MISLFRTNQLLASVFYLPYLAVLRLPVFLYPDRFPGPTFIPAWLPEWLANGLDHIWVLEAMNWVFLLSTAFFLTFTAAVQRVDREITLFPGLVFLWLSALLPELLTFSLILPACLLLWASLDQLVGTYRQYQPVYRLFNVGFWLGLAGCLYPSFCLFLPMAYLLLNLLRSMNLKEYYLVTVGFFTPWALLLFGLFYTDHLHELWPFVRNSFGFARWPEHNGFPGIWILLPYLLLLLIVLASRSFYVSKKLMPERKTIRAVYWLLLFAGIVAAFSGPVQPELLILLSMPLGFLLAMNLSRLSPGLLEGVHLLGLLLYVFFQYGSLFFPGG